MRIVSHRGWWLDPAEKNTEVAFVRALNAGLGIETDVRDFCGQLVISHDVPAREALSFDQFLELGEGHEVPLAINIKADGLSELVSDALTRRPMFDARVFDMSVPDTRAYLGRKIPILARVSEVETPSGWLKETSGVWLDGFESTWFGPDDITTLREAGEVWIVSPELHGRDHSGTWEMLGRFADDPGVVLCTDYPDQAIRLFRLGT